MDNQLPELKVNMLGRFSITYGDQPITFKRNSATKAVKLLQILLHSSLTENQGNGGISRAQLLDDLFGREELANVGNNLRVTGVPSAQDADRGRAAGVRLYCKRKRCFLLAKSDENRSGCGAFRGTDPGRGTGGRESEEDGTVGAGVPSV